MDQLKSVETLRSETAADMDSRLANLANKQRMELETCNNTHKEVITAI